MVNVKSSHAFKTENLFIEMYICGFEFGPEHFVAKSNCSRLRRKMKLKKTELAGCVHSHGLHFFCTVVAITFQ